jgi:hypothetical protein
VLFPFGQIETDALLQASAYSGRTVALLRVKQIFFLFGQIETDASLEACV